MHVQMCNTTTVMARHIGSFAEQGGEVVVNGDQRQRQLDRDWSSSVPLRPWRWQGRSWSAANDGHRGMGFGAIPATMIQSGD
jgi:hypothetical protein